MAVGDIFEVRIICTSGDQTAINVTHCAVIVDTGSGPALQDIANGAFFKFSTPYRPLMAMTSVFRAVGVRKIRPTPISLEVFSTDTPLSGTAGGDALPRQVSGVLSLRTAFGGRRQRGRVYVPFPSEDSNTSSAAPDPTYVSNLAALGFSFLSNMGVTSGGGSATLSWGVYHRNTGTIDDAILSIAQPRWGTQRRRGMYGRPNPPPV